MKIVYYGSSGSLSLIPLYSLLESQHTIGAIVVTDKAASKFSVITQGTISSVAFDHTIPLLHFTGNESEVENQLAAFNPDLIVVSCFLQRIPSSIISLAKFGGINIHPSLLPFYRGPDPLFWQYRDGVKNFGISVHEITDEFDAGDIILQKEMLLKDGLSVEQASAELANHAKDLLLSFLHKVEENNLTRVKQDEVMSSYQSFPTKDDYMVKSDWTARRIYNFIKAFEAENSFFECDINGKLVKLTSAISYQQNPYPGIEGNRVLYKKSRVIFPCKDGFIECKYKD